MFREAMKVIRNTEGLYEGNLVYYFKIVYADCRKRKNPYHNLYHTLWVVLQVSNACKYYRDRLAPIEIFIILMAALFHDFKHPGIRTNDALNIETAILAMDLVLLDEHVQYFEKIAWYIRTTEHPYVIEERFLDLCAQILRDADMSQVFSPEGVPYVVNGLSKEWKEDPRDLLEMQPTFIRNIKFLTGWAKETFGPLVPKRIAEAENMLQQFA